VEIVTENGQTKTKRYLPGGAFEITQNAVASTRYMFTDHLGNLVQIATELGASVEAMDYTAFGARRDFIQPMQLPASTPTLTTKGYTGHEMVDEMGLIHMNGRIFDTRTARFMQADPMVQDPSNGQNFNRYTYVWNNPLAYTDPSGYMSVSKVLGNVATFLKILSFIPGLQFLAPIADVLGMLARYAGIVEAFAGGGIKGGLLAAFAPTGGSGNPVLDALGSALYAGISARIMGGKFADGVIGALKSAAISFVTSSIGKAFESAQTGGKMANGAITRTQDEASTSPSSAAAGTSGSSGEQMADNTLVDAKRFSNLHWSGSAMQNPQFMTDVREMITYADSTGITILDEMNTEAAADNTKVYLTDKWHDGSPAVGMNSYPAVTSSGRPAHYIAMDTRSGLRVDKGVQSPALGFLHEASHALNIFKGPGVLGLNAMSQRERNKFFRLEYPQTIRAEQSMARLLGEPIRRDHSGSNVTVACATCRR
jgi:RHS repeat-associated protein